MNYNLVEEKVLNSLKNSLNLDVSISKEKIALYKVASWDSLNHLNVIINLETDFNIEITVDDSIRMINLIEITNIIYNNYTQNNLMVNN